MADKLPSTMTDAEFLLSLANVSEDDVADKLRAIAANLEALLAENIRLKEQVGRQFAALQELQAKVEAGAP